MRDRAVEADRVALVERVERAVEIDLDRAAGDVDRDLAALDVELGGPAAAASRPLAQRRLARLARQRAHDGALEILAKALAGAHDTHRIALSRRRPQLGDRD